MRFGYKFCSLFHTGLQAFSQQNTRNECKDRSKCERVSNNMQINDVSGKEEEQEDLQVQPTN